VSTPTYVLIFSGEVLEGFDVSQVKERMASLIRADENKLTTLFSGKTNVIKRSPNKDEVLKIMTALKAIGADVRIRLTKDKPPATKTVARPNDPVQVEAASNGLTLAANVGYLVEPAEQAPEPLLDLSGISIAGDDSTTVTTETSTSDQVTIDTSALSLKENDGSPLIEATAPETPVEAPDFMLDKLGTLLDATTEEIDPVIPDTSQLSMREMQGNLLEDTEKSTQQTSLNPDISHLHTIDLPEQGDS
jgi:hypothetical protein